MKPEEIESARKALADIGRIVDERDAARSTLGFVSSALDRAGVAAGSLDLRVSKLAAERDRLKEERDKANHGRNVMLEEAASLHSELARLKSELAARPVVESDAARKLRAKCEAAVRSGWEATPELAEWLATPLSPAVDADINEVVMLRGWRDSVVARSIAAGRKVPGEGLCEWFEGLARKAAQPDDYTRLAVAYAEAMAEDGPTDYDAAWVLWKAAYDARQRGESVSRLAPLEQAAVEAMEAYVDENWESARDRYLALRDGEHVTEKEKPDPHQPEPVDVWLAQYKDGVIAILGARSKIKDWPNATRFLRARIPVVEVVENEKGGV